MKLNTEYIKGKMEELGLTQSDLARKVGWRRQFVNDLLIEDYVGRSFNTVKRIGVALDLTEDEMAKLVVFD